MKLKRRDGPPDRRIPLRRRPTADEQAWLDQMSRASSWEWQLLREWLRMLIIKRSELT